MICKYCGNNLADNTLFCSTCGERVAAEKTTPVNKKELLSGFQPSGDKMGDIKRLRAQVGHLSFSEGKELIDRLYATKAVSNIRADTHTSETIKVVSSDTLIAKSSRLTQYPGDKKLSTRGADGHLLLYGDRLVFETTVGAVLIQGGRTKTFPLADIASVTRGRYAIGESILLTLRSGEKYTYATILSGEIYAFMDQINRQLG